MRRTYFDSFKHLLDFKGTADRMQYWVPVIINYMIGALLVIRIALLKGDTLRSIMTGGADIHLVGRLVLMVVWLLLISVKVRRLHDINLSSWWVLIDCLPGIGAIAMTVVGLIPTKRSRWRAVQ